MDETLERNWVVQAQNGNLQALDALIRVHQAHVFNVARRIVKDHDDAQDVSQDVFRILLESLPTFRGDARLSTWLHRVTVNASLMYLRKSSRRARYEGPHRIDCVEIPSPMMALEDLQDSRRLLNDVQRVWPRLSPVHREILSKRAIEEAAILDIALELGLSLPATKSRLSRARAHLRKSLTKDAHIADFRRRNPRASRSSAKEGSGIPVEHAEL